LAILLLGRKAGSEIRRCSIDDFPSLHYDYREWLARAARQLLEQTGVAENRPMGGASDGE
jgi:hypothetical protein